MSDQKEQAQEQQAFDCCVLCGDQISSSRQLEFPSTDVCGRCEEGEK